MESKRITTSSIHDPEYREIVNVLIELRKKASLSQTDLADAIGLTQPDISKIERRERRIDVLEFFRWLSATNADYQQFFDKFIRNTIG